MPNLKLIMRVVVAAFLFLLPLICKADGSAQTTATPANSTADITATAATQDSAAASDALFFGSWRGAEESTMSIIGYLHVTKTQISWDGSQYSPACSTSYEVLTRKKGRGHYPDERQPNSKMPETSEYTTMKLRLDSSTCQGKIVYMSLIVRPSLPYHLDVIAYDANDNISGTFSFSRFPSG